MILCAALKLHNDKYESDLVIPCWRHAVGYEILADVEFDYHSFDITEGFITTSNIFLDRTEAYQHARECGQIPYQLVIDKAKKQEKELFSEDLY